MFLPSSRRYLRKSVYPYLCFLTVRAANTQTYPQLFEIIPCFFLFFNRGRQIFSLCHFHPYLLRHLDQSKPVKNPINIRNPTDISKILWSGCHRFPFCLFKSPPHRTPGQAFTVLPSVDPKLLCILSVTPPFQKRKGILLFLI